MIEAVLWDVDDTLFDFTGSDRRALSRHFQAEGLPGSAASVERWQQVTEVAYGRLAAGELTYEECQRQRVNGFLGRTLNDVEADAWLRRYTALFERAWTAFPDVTAALAALPYRHGILSNSSTAHQERRLTALGLRHHFEVLLCADRLARAKPDPSAFLAGCEALGLPPDAVAYVGDQLDTDAVAARDAGLVGIWLDRARSTAAATSRSTVPVPVGVHRIPSLADLPRLLAAPGE
ncbi:HAD family hydrolase [Salinispora pacifica]|uniref:HAD family hydrolase n=1 Tax=Salinispora pacifica TaxID=351187 RepID=UPI00037000EF|nr:HAD family hydrolase [Salinispora pacifica]